jgi:hypothetical protein
MPEDTTVLTTADTTTSTEASKTESTTAAPATAKAPEGGKTEATTTTEAQTKPEIVPEKYDLKPPKDSPLTEAEVLSTADMAKALGLTQEKAQNLLEQRSADRASFVQAQQEFVQQQVKGWEAATAKDPEIAGKDGSEFKQNVAYAKQVVGKYASPAMIKALNETGFGNHPELVRFMVRIGKAMKEDQFQTGSETNGSDNADLETRAAKKFFKTTNKE